MHHHNGNAKLTPQRVIEMRRLRAEGWSYPQLARAFKVSGNTVQKICTGQSWQNVTGGEEILTDGEAQLRLLNGGGGPSAPSPLPLPMNPEELAASAQRLMAMQEQILREQTESAVPPQYRRSEDPIADMREMNRKAEERKARNEALGVVPPPATPVRYPEAEAETKRKPDLGTHEALEQEQGAIKAEQLLETLKDEHNLELRRDHSDPSSSLNGPRSGDDRDSHG